MEFHPFLEEDRQDLEGWLSCRNCEVLNALEFGDVATVDKVGALCVTRVCEDGGVRARCPHEQPGEIFSDVKFDLCGNVNGVRIPTRSPTRVLQVGVQQRFHVIWNES